MKKINYIILAVLAIVVVVGAGFALSHKSNSDLGASIFRADTKTVTTRSSTPKDISNPTGGDTGAGSLVNNNGGQEPAGYIGYSAGANFWCFITGGHYDSTSYDGMEHGWRCAYLKEIGSSASVGVIMVSSETNPKGYENACLSMGGVLGKDSASCMVAGNNPKFMALSKSYINKNITAKQKSLIRALDDLGAKPDSGGTDAEYSFWAWFYCDYTRWGTWTPEGKCIHLPVSPAQSATQ